MINNLIIKKRKFLPLFLLTIVFTSCGGYKGSLEKETDNILSQLKVGNYSVIPGLDERVNQLDSSAREELDKSFSSMEFWEISVGDIVNDRVDVNVDLSIDDVSKRFIFQFYKEGSKWILSEKMVITENITYVPTEIKKEAD